MNNERNNYLTCFGLVVYLFIIILVGTILGGWVLTYLWRWFIVPVFQFEQVTVVQAIGLSLIINYLIYKPKEVDEYKEKSISELLIKGTIQTLLTPLFTLLLGWVVSLFL